MARHTANYNLVKPDETDFYDIGVHNGNMDVIDGALKAAVPLKGTGMIPASGWVPHNGKNALKINVAITGVDVDDWVEIVINQEYQDIAQDAEINPTGTEYGGGVTLYANVMPTEAIPFRYKVVKMYG